MKLFHQVYFAGQVLPNWPASVKTAPVLIIPGLFGSTGNWRGFAKSLSADRHVIVVDQRNHGQSPHAVENSYLDLVGDIVDLLNDLDIQKVSLCGHSMGGKTAMLFALNHSSRLANLIVLDIAPATYGHSHAPILKGLKGVDLASASSRSEIEKQLQAAIPDKSTRMFIMLSLAGRSGEFYWRLNVDALLENLTLIGGFPEIDTSCYEEPALFIRGDRSDYLKAEHHDEIERLFPNAQIETIENAGHWVHIDQPVAVLAQIETFFKKREKNDKFQQ